MDEIDLKAYYAARESVAVMDRSAWGRVRMSGGDRVDFLHRMSTNEVRDLAPGISRRTVLTSDVARIVAVVTAYAFSDHLLLLAEPGAAERVMGHLGGYIFFRDNVQLSDITAETGMLSLWGPEAAAFLENLVGLNIADLAVDAFIETNMDQAASVVTHTDDLGPDGFNLIVDRDDVGLLLRRLIDAGAELIGESTYEVLRVEAGQPKYGREMGEAFNPLEAGLKSIISFEKGCYIGQEVVARLDTYDKVKQHLVGVVLERLPAADERLTLASRDDKIGFLTSWVQSPICGPIALGYVLTKHLEPEMSVEVVDTEGRISGQVVDRPFA